ncbi:hypothetical protein DID88_007589 [Monilinia fructigena]|uniref:DUF5672 domain-containing protein n=1 Tax=Monilinia fructigena TaxID=38457 RepID=A0A395J3H9_9HELO|nr:hypothetical protein DID88_007589 [Monilinia fructigena]
MAPSHESGPFLWYNRRMHRSFILAICILSLLMLVVYHQYDWSSISDFHLAKLAPEPGAAGEPVAQAPNPPTATINNESGTAKSENGGVDLKTDHPKPSAAPTDSKGSLATTNAELDPTRVALLLETRPLPHLPALLAHFISVLPAPWAFRFVGSPEANSLISSSSSLSAHVKSGKLLITSLPAKYNITSQETISATLTDPTFYKDFLAPAEWVLMFQSDSIICSASERSIEEYISADYSWVGAPWNMAVTGGNGGLSLRHIPPILKVTEKESRKPGDPWEDRWICDRLLELDPKKMPGPEVEATFSVEKIKIVLDMDLIRETEKLTKELEQLKNPKVAAEKEKETEKDKGNEKEKEKEKEGEKGKEKGRGLD